MNTAIQAALDHAVQTLQQEGVLPSDWNNSSNLTRTKDRSHGDFASNIAMIGSKAAGMKPRDLAEKILAALPEVADISKAEIAGPGFINFFLNADQRFAILDQIQAQKALVVANQMQLKRFKLNSFLQTRRLAYT